MFNPYHSLIFIHDVNKTSWQRLLRTQPITSHFHSYLCCVSPYCHIKFDSPVIRILKPIHISARYHPTNLLSPYSWMFYPGELLYTPGLTQPLRNYSWLYLGEYSRRVTTDSQRSQMVRLFLSGVSFPLSRLLGVQSNNVVQQLRLIRRGKEILAILGLQEVFMHRPIPHLSRRLKFNPSGVLPNIRPSRLPQRSSRETTSDVSLDRHSYFNDH